jgi:hypothetical protein
MLIPLTLETSSVSSISSLLILAISPISKLTPLPSSSTGVGSALVAVDEQLVVITGNAESCDEHDEPTLLVGLSRGAWD